MLDFAFAVLCPRSQSSQSPSKVRLRSSCSPKPRSPDRSPPDLPPCWAHGMIKIAQCDEGMMKKYGIFMDKYIG